MKQLSLAGWGLLATAFLSTGWLLWGAQKQPARPTTPRARVAILNVTHVLKNHPKYQAAQKEIQEVFRHFEERERNLLRAIDAVRRELRDDTLTLDRRVMQQDQLKALEREIEETKAAGKAAIAKRADEKMAILHKDITDAVERYAAAHDIDLVLQYKDTDTEDNRQNTARRWEAIGCLPLYAAPGLDVTRDIIMFLDGK